MTRYDTRYDHSERAVHARRIGSLMRRFRQLAVIHAHFEAVLKEGKRELSGQELWRAQQFAGELGSIAASLREYRTELPDVPGIVEVK
jgi:hypothetical protein